MGRVTMRGLVTATAIAQRVGREVHRLTVELLGRFMRIPNEDEYAALGRPSHRRVYVREVVLHADGRPVVLYNPHVSPHLSSWFRVGRQILDWFVEHDEYQLIFAPHVMLFERSFALTIDKLRIDRPGRIEDPREYGDAPELLAAPAPEPYVHDVPHSHRSGRRVEPLISLQWFCDMEQLARPAIEVVRDERIRFHPAKPWTANAPRFTNSSSVPLAR